MDECDNVLGHVTRTIRTNFTRVSIGDLSFNWPMYGNGEDAKNI